MTLTDAVNSIKSYVASWSRYDETRFDKLQSQLAAGFKQTDDDLVLIANEFVSLKQEIQKMADDLQAVADELTSDASAMTLAASAIDALLAANEALKSGDAAAHEKATAAATQATAARAALQTELDKANPPASTTTEATTGDKPATT